MTLRPQGSREWLDAWQAKDARGESCSSCHSPDGIELADFSESDIRRRTARHHKDPIAEKIRLLIGSHKPTGQNGSNLRPLQPAGKVLEGKTPAKKDERFLGNLKQSLPNLFRPIKNLAEAESFQEQILAIDLDNLPVGIEMNRMSEDGAHGPEHASVANWFPDLAVFDSASITSDEEAYLQKPNEETLRQLDQKVVASAKATNAFALLSLSKYRCLLVYQHELRTGKRSSFLPEGNPFWQVAEFGRIYHESDSQTIRVPAEIAKTKNMDTTLRAQMKQIRTPWYWLGWIRDPSLTKSGLMGETLRADYFCKYLEEDGPYMGHEVFMLTRKLAEQDRNPLTPNHPREIQYSFFLASTPLIQREPQSPEAKMLFRQFAANSFRMSLLLLEKDLKAKKKAFQPVPQLSQIKFLSQYLSAIKVPETELVQRVTKLLKQVGKV